MEQRSELDTEQILLIFITLLKDLGLVNVRRKFCLDFEDTNQCIAEI